jgi:hypothetical protein
MIDLSTIPFEEIPAAGSLPTDAFAVIPEGASVADALKILKKKQFAHDSIPLLADALPEREAVWWASKSCERAGPSLAPADLSAAKAAEAWVKAPSAETAAAASAAAQEAGFDGPGAFAAQAAALAEDPPVLVGGDAIGASLAKQAAGGSVRLASLAEAGLLPAAVPAEAVAVAAAASAAVAAVAVTASESNDTTEADHQASAEDEPPTRKERKKASKASEPHVKLGQEIASGENHW